MKLRVDGLVIIHIDTLRREFSYCYVLAKVFESLGYRVLLASRRNLKAILSVLSPQILILSHSFTLPKESLRKIKDEKTNIYIIPVETVGDETLMYPTAFPGDIDCSVFNGIFMWNNHFKDWLVRERGADPDRVYVFGSPRLNLCRFIKKKKNNNVIGFIGRFEFINDYAKRMPLSTLLTLPETHEYFFYRWFAEIEGSFIYGRLIPYLIESGYKISIRPHPHEYPATYNILKHTYGGKVLIDDSVDFLGWLENVDALVATLSTSLTEAHILGKPIISIDKMFKENYMIHFDKHLESYLSVCHTPASVDEAKELLKKPLTSKCPGEEMNAFLKRYYNVKDDKGFSSLENIVRVVHSQNRDTARVNKLTWSLARVLYVAIDTVLLLKNVRHRAFYLNRHYNFCFLIHKPTDFMKRAASGIAATLKSSEQNPKERKDEK